MDDFQSVTRGGTCVQVKAECDTMNGKGERTCVCDVCSIRYREPPEMCFHARLPGKFFAANMALEIPCVCVAKGEHMTPIQYGDHTDTKLHVILTSEPSMRYVPCANMGQKMILEMGIVLWGRVSGVTRYLQRPKHALERYTSEYLRIKELALALTGKALQQLG
jgi:hypothetical protein